MRKIYSFLLMLLMAAVSVNAAVKTSGEGWELYGHKLYVELPLMDWHEYHSASEVPWAAVSGQVQEVHIIRGDFSLDTPDILYINPYMFAEMYSLRYVYIQLYDANKIMICAHAFENSTLYGMSRYEGKITSVEEYAFKNCRKLESIRFNDDNDVCFVNEHAFEGCTKLISVYGKIERVGASAFKGCTVLETIDLSKVLSIGDNAFNGCGQLRAVNLKKCMQIGKSAFRECYLPAVTIEDCTSIGNNAFYYGIMDNGDLYMNRTVPPTLGTDVFFGVSLTTVTLHLPDNATGFNGTPWSDFRSETTPSEIYGALSGTTVTLYYDDQRSTRGGTLWSFSAYYKADLMNTATKIVFDPTMSAANITDMDNWFNGFKKVTAFEGFSNLYTQNVTSMSGLFSGCIGLQTIDLNGLDMSAVEDIRGMFNGCTNLQKIYCEKDWSQNPNITNAYNLFYGCTNLVGGRGTAFDTNHRELDYARPDGAPDAPGYFWRADDTGEVPDSRTVIRSCAFTGFDVSSLQPGMEWTFGLAAEIAATLQNADPNAPYYVPINANVLYKGEIVDENLVREGEGVLTEGSYIFIVQIRIDGENGTLYRFPDSEEGTMNVTVDGTPWSVESTAVLDDCSFIWIISPVFQIESQGVDNVQSGNVQSTKLLRNGVLLIERNGKTYNAIGAELK